MGALPPPTRSSRTGDGTLRPPPPGPERELLADLVDQLRELLVATTDDPSVRRLFPTAYHEDPERDREYQQLVRDELLERRLAALATVEATAAADELDEAELTGWLTALNDLRLVLGTRLDVSEDQAATSTRTTPTRPPMARVRLPRRAARRGRRRARRRTSRRPPNPRCEAREARCYVCAPTHNGDRAPIV